MALGIEHRDEVIEQVETLDGDGRAREADPESDVLEDDVNVDDQPCSHLLWRNVVGSGGVGIPRALVECREGGSKVAFRVVILAEELSEEVGRSVGSHLL